MLSPNQRFELVLWSFCPALIALALSMLFLSSKHMSGLNQVMPLLHVTPIFYWGMLRAKEMPYWFVFLLGMVLDAVMGLPMGLTSLIFIVFLLLLHEQRKYIHREGFVAKWSYFTVLLGAMVSLNWFVLALFQPQLEGLGLAVIQWLLTVCCYPVFHRLFDILNAFIHTRRWYILNSIPPR